MNLQIILILVIFKVSQGLLLTKNSIKSCLGEEVVFTCTVEEGSQSLSWRLIVTRDSNIPALPHTFYAFDYEMPSLRRMTWSRDGFHVELKLVDIEPALVSTLSANLTSLLIDAAVTCQQYSPVVQAKSGHFSLASVPSIPVQITDIDYQYGCMNFNVSLSWIPPHGDHRTDYYRLSRIDGQAHVLVNDTSYVINSLPYFENATLEIDIVNCAGEGAELYVTISKGGCLSLNSSENSCLTPAGYQTTIECEPGEVPEEILSTCQEDGSWIPDAMECTVGCRIPSFPNNITFMITNSKVHIGLPANVTTIGSEIQLFCGNQTSQKSVSPVLTAFCGENGTWSPDIRSGHIECAVDQKSTDVHTQRPLSTHVYIIIGASTGCGAILLLIVLMCVCLCIIRKLCKKRRYNVDQTDSLYPDSEFQYKLGEIDPQDASLPQYETISPLYDIIPENTGPNHSEIYLRMMNNNAYCESSAKCIQ